MAVFRHYPAKIRFPNMRHFANSKIIMAAKVSQRQLDREEQLARIRRLIEESDQRRAETERVFDERRRLQQEHQLAPWQLAFGGVTAGAALFAAAAAFTKYFL